jgi:hypothetical protein
MILDFPDLTEEYLKKLDEIVNDEKDPITYIAIDPGNSNGVCGYNSKGHLMFMTTINEKDLLKFLKVFQKIILCVTENYLIYEHKLQHHRGSDVLTLRVIGRIENWCELSNIQLVKQLAAIKNTGYLWLGKKPLPKSNPANHKWDAHVHFIYWAVRKGLIKAADLLRKEGV